MTFSAKIQTRNPLDREKVDKNENLETWEAFKREEKEDREIKEGDVVTVAFDGKRGRVEIVRVRKDISWSSVLTNSVHHFPNFLKRMF